MTPQEELDIKISAMNLGRALGEIMFCSFFPKMTGPVRRDEAIRTFGESVVNLIKLIPKD